MIISETDLINILKASVKCVLIEPPYKTKYLPLGLAKISSLIKSNGGDAVFQRNYNYAGEDLICMTTLFTYDSKFVVEEIERILFLNPKSKLVIGGVFATLNADYLNDKFPNAHIFKGYSIMLDMYAPDYNTDWKMKEEFKDFSYVFTTRGCPNTCPYCAVKKLEPEAWLNDTWKCHIDKDKPNVMVYDNNLTAFDINWVKDVFNFFNNNNKKLLFDNGFDVKTINDDIAKILVSAKYYKDGLRVAFDRIEEDGVFQTAVERLVACGAKPHKIMVYVLFNFNDTPQDANYRMKECARLGLRPYPQKYVPLNKLSRLPAFIGRHWTKNLAESFRYFWRQQGYYKKMEFIDWFKSKDNKYFKCIEEDIGKYEGHDRNNNSVHGSESE